MTQAKMPEPVAHRYRVIDDEWEYSEQSFFVDGGNPGDQEESDSLITTTQAEAYKDDCLREALESVLNLLHDSRVHVEGFVFDSIQALLPPTKSEAEE